MASATSNRPNPSLPGVGRRTQFGDFSTVGGRSSENEKPNQTSILGQNIGNGTLNWPTPSLTSSSAIWGKPAIGSGFVNGKKDTSRAREEDDFTGAKGSGALAASSEADPWGRTLNGGPWNTDTSPTTTHSTTGSNSPVRLRSSNAITTSSDVKIGSSYFPAPHTTAIGQGPSASFGSRPQAIKSNMNPTTASFKNGGSFVGYGIDHNKESSAMNSSLDIDQSPRTVRLDSRAPKNTGYMGIGSRESSLPPSRHSESGPSVPVNNPSFGNASTSYGNFNHTPSNSFSLHRPSLPSQHFSSQSNGRNYADSSTITTTPQVSDLNQNLGRFSFSAEKSNGVNSQPAANNDQSYALQGNYSNYDFQPYPQNGMYGGMTDSHKGYGASTPDGYPEQPFAHQYAGGSFRVPRTGERGTNSPANSEYRRGLGTPYYSTGGTPPIDSMDPYRPASRDLRGQANGDSVAYIDRKLQRLHVTQTQPQPYYQYSPQFQTHQYAQQAYDHPNQNLAPYSNYISIPSYIPNGPTPRGPARDDIGHGVRSLLLDEFRSNSKSNKRYDLKDIYNHVVEFSGDQHGSRFIQQKLETANSDEKEQIFLEIQPNALQLMTDVFGNYVIQKMFEHGNQVQKRIMAELMRNHVQELSMQMYGCRVVQKALEHVLANQQADLVRELQTDVLKCVKDQNGNHVIQKAIERVPTAHIQFIIDAFRGQVHTLATHPYGCRVIQRMLEYCTDQDQAGVLEELHLCAQMLITDQYGNYVIQHVIVHGKVADRAKIINIVTGQLLAFSKHKFASNVVEKSILFGSDEQRAKIISGLTTVQGDQVSPLQLMMKDQYGNYVIQKLLHKLEGAEHTQFVADMKPQLEVLKKYNFGKQIAAIEKLIFTGPHPPTQPAAMTNMGIRENSHSHTAPTLDVSFISATPTPQLTMETNSPQSSSAPSTNVSTVDGPTESKGDIEIKGMLPEVRVIESG